MEVGQYQQAAPFVNVSNLGKILGGIQAPATVYNQTQLSPLNQVGSLLTFLGGQTGQGGVLGQIGVEGGLQGIFRGIRNLFPGGSGGINLGDYASGVGDGPIDWSAGPGGNPNVPDWAWNESYD